jgi:uncharacterized protein involved in exopolysaccharide biosynthesis
MDHYLAASTTRSASHALAAVAGQEHARVGRDLRDSEERLARWRETHGVVSVEAALATELQALAQREGVLREVVAERAAVGARVAALKRQRPAHPRQVPLLREHVANPLITTLEAELASAEAALAGDQASPLVAKLKGDLVAADLALHELRQRYTDKERRVEEKVELLALLKRELAAAEAEAARAARSRIEGLQRELTTARSQAEILGRQTVGLNPVREQLERELGSAAALLASLDSRRAALQAQVRETRDTLADLGTKRLEEERLVRSAALARESLQLHAKKLDEARLTAGAQHEFGRLSVVEPPYVLRGPGLLTRINVALVAFMAGLMISGGLAFGYEFGRNALRRREDVEYYLAVPLLAAIPDRTRANQA